MGIEPKKGNPVRNSEEEGRREVKVIRMVIMYQNSPILEHKFCIVKVFRTNKRIRRIGQAMLE